MVAPVWLEQLSQDVRYALRAFGQSPVFALTAVLSLAVGIGADTSVFSVANALLLRTPAGVLQPTRLVDISATDPDDSYGVNQISLPNFLDLRARATTLENIYAYEPVAEPMSLADTEGAQRIFGHRVTTSYFEVLGVRGAVGRLFDPGVSEQSATGQTVVLSHAFWTRRFNQHAGVVGRVVSLNGLPFTVVGVAPPGFHGTSLVATDVWIPLSTTTSTTSPHAHRSSGWALARARLKPGVSISQATSEVTTIGRVLEQEHPDDNRGTGLRLGAASFIPGNLALPLAGVAALVMGFVSLILVIACANLAGVLLARATARRREIAVRVAVGASRGRLMRQLLTETIILFVLGGAAGLLLARGLTSSILMLLPSLPIPLELALPLDGRTIAFASGVSLLAAVLCGLVPALSASRPDVIATLKDEAAGISARSRLRSLFVVSQVALSILLVAGAGVFARALQKTSAIDPGFDPHGVELASIDLSLANYSSTAGQQFVHDVAHRVRQIPGVRDATITANLPMGGASRYGRLSHPGIAAPERQQSLPADWYVVEPHYFSTMRIAMVAGRDFSDADRRGRPAVIIVSQEAARRYWPGQDPIGKSLLQHPTVMRRGADNSPETLRVIGVVRDVKTRFRDAPLPQVYLPLQQQYVPRVTIAARTLSGERIAAEIRHVVSSMNGNLPILNAQTLEEAAAFALLPQRISTAVSASLGIVGLLLAAMGIYGVTAYAAAQRTREIGIRIALGATRNAIIAMVLTFGMRLVTSGVVVGLVMAIVLNVVLTNMLSGFPPMDAIAFAAAAALFGIVGLVACYLPVRRATRVDPAVVLRYE